MMQLKLSIAVILLTIWQSIEANESNSQALFVRKDAIRQISKRATTPDTSADVMVQNILQWLQNIYSQNNRKIRQGTLREYLPPLNTERPRPFQPITQIPIGGDASNNVGYTGGYAPSGSIKPQPPFPTYQPPYSSTSGTSSGGGISVSVLGSGSGTTNLPGPETNYIYPDQPSYTAAGGDSGSVSVSVGGNIPSSSPSPTYSSPGTYPTYTGGSISTGGGTSRPSYPSGGTVQPSYTGGPLSGGTVIPGSNVIASQPSPSFPTPTVPARPSGGSYPSPSPGPGPVGPDDGNHPPHIHDINVECAKDSMTINLEFNREYNGIIYSKGFFNNPACRYVNENSGSTKYSFTVSLNSCGTEFVNGFESQGQSYLENVLVLQNEPGIQEVWDTIRSVRCLWEGNLNKALSVALSVGMLTQEIVTFSGDTAMARLDIQMGRGPFAQPAAGLVKIGELMTLVVSVTGDPDFDVQVRDCKARDGPGENVVALTDDNGCVLKPKLFGAFQKTRDTQNTGASIIAYAFFNAFKFPDIMDLILECNIELCKTDCQMCTDPNQKSEPGRRRKRDAFNETIGDPVKMSKSLQIYLPEDMASPEELIDITEQVRHERDICMSQSMFIFGGLTILSLLLISTTFSIVIWFRLKQHRMCNKY